MILRSRCYQVVPPTLIIAFMLTLMPLPDWAQAFRPDWVTLVLLYWLLAVPEHVGVTFAFVCGLLLDVAHGAILGQHAIGLVLIAFVVAIQYQKIRVFSLVQQALVVFALLMIKQLLVIWVSGIVGQTADFTGYLVQSLVGAVLWPWIFIILRDIRRRFTISKNF